MINLIFAGFFLLLFFPCAEYEKSNRLSSHLTMNSAFFALMYNKNTIELSFSKSLPNSGSISNQAITSNLFIHYYTITATSSYSFLIMSLN